MIGMDSSPFIRGIIRREKAWVQQADEEEADTDATTVAVDLAKDVFREAVSNQVEEVRR